MGKQIGFIYGLIKSVLYEGIGNPVRHLLEVRGLLRN